MLIHAFAADGAKAALQPFTYEPGGLGPGEIEVRVTHCGICHSDLAMIDNDWTFSQYPLVPGHEVIGEILEVGLDVAGLSVGQRVGIGWQCGSCGHCTYCRRGRENFCAQERDTIVQHHGGFADRVRADANFAIPIPDTLPSAEAAPLLCAGTTVFTPLLYHRVTGTMRTAVVGIGGLGHLAIQFLAKMGCEVTAISTTRSKEDEARAFGATAFLATKDTTELREAAGRFDFIISTVPADLPWPEYVAALAPEGTLCIVGIPEHDVQFPALSLVSAARKVSGGRTGSPSDIGEMFQFAARHGVKAQIERFPMQEVNAALDRVRSGKARYRVVLEA